MVFLCFVVPQTRPNQRQGHHLYGLLRVSTGWSPVDCPPLSHEHRQNHARFFLQGCIGSDLETQSSFPLTFSLKRDRSEFLSHVNSLFLFCQALSAWDQRVPLALEDSCGALSFAQFTVIFTVIQLKPAHLDKIQI